MKLKCYPIIGTLAVAFLLCFSMPASAQVYRWVDQDGVTHFTDNPQNIPKQHRDKASDFTPPQITTYTDERKSDINVPTQTRDVQRGSVQDSGESTEELKASIKTLKSQIQAKRDLVKYVDDRRNLAINPLRNRIITENELELYDRYVQELPEDERDLEELESTLLMMEKSGRK